MLVKVKPGYTIYREGYVRNQKSGVFRLFEVPPSKDEPADPDNPEGPSKFDVWLGTSLDTPTDAEVYAFENDPARNLDYRDTLHSTNLEETMGRAGAIAFALQKLDHDKDEHWLPNDEPNIQAVRELSKLPKLEQYEIRAVALEFRRTPKEHRAAPRKRFTDKG